MKRGKDDKSLIFLHMGKAGGGTINNRLRKIWNHVLGKYICCHPSPCSIEKISEYDAVIISLRDPVDRFVSAFRWTMLLLCQPNDERVPYQTVVMKDPEKYCKMEDAGGKGSHILHGKHHGNINSLAEGLCDNNIGGGIESRSNNDDVKQILNMKHSITDWMMTPKTNRVSSSPFWFRNNTRKNIVAIIQEPGYSFIDQIDAGMEWIIRQKMKWLSLEEYDDQVKLLNRTLSRILKQARNVEHDPLDYITNGASGGVKQANTNINTFNDKDISPLHSSSLYNVNTNDQLMTLSVLGECCVARYYSSDYDLLHTLLLHVCNGNGSNLCESAIRSILKRRRELLLRHGDEGFSTCHEYAITAAKKNVEIVAKPINLYSTSPKNVNTISQYEKNTLLTPLVAMIILTLVIGLSCYIRCAESIQKRRSNYRNRKKI